MRSISRAVKAVCSAGLLLGLTLAVGVPSAEESGTAPGSTGAQATQPPASGQDPSAHAPATGHDHAAHSRMLTGSGATATEEPPQAGQPADPAASAGAKPADPEEAARRYFTDLEVVDQDGRRLRFYSDVLKDRVVIINFIFTNCQDACPMMTRKLIQTRAMMAEPVRDKVWFVSISIDPTRDTPEAMKEFAAKNGVDDSRWIFLTGQEGNLGHIVKKLGQYTGEVEDHSTLMLAGNARTRHWIKVVPMVPPEGIAQQLRGLAEEG